jgi:fatty-acyl-CoA synthase
MKVVKLDPDGTYVRDCEDDEIGTLVVSGPNVFPGYVQKDENRDIWVDGRWLNTGDLARCDADGYFYITGRSKDLIIRGGHNIYPATIENVLHKHPDVVTAAAVGKPDAYAGELPVAYVVLRPGASTTSEALKAFARENIDERGAAPVEITLLDAMPLTAVGKIAKTELRFDAVRRSFEGVLAPVAARVHVLEVLVQEHRRQGSLATIRVKVDVGKADAVRTDIQRLLAPYAIAVSIVIEA